MAEGSPKERRKHKRVPIAQPATATCGVRRGKVVNASMSGMAIIHQGPAAVPGEIVEVGLRYGEYSFQLPVTVVWDEPLEGPEEAQRRCGMAFQPLDRRERYWLEHFLWSQTNGWPEIPTPDELA